MSGGAHAGDDDIAYYAASLGCTRKLDVTSAPTQLTDADGPLEPGRYLLQARFGSGSNSDIWVAMGPFEKGETLVVAADVPHFPFLENGVIAIEVNVRPVPKQQKATRAQDRPNNQVAAVTSSGSATLYITAISRGA